MMSVEYFRVDHHDQEWDGFIPTLHAAALCVTAAVPGTTPWLHLGWYRGPHLLVGVASPVPLDDSARAHMQASLRVAVSDNRSERDIDADEWERRSIVLAREDLIEGPYVPLYPDNTVTAVDRHEARIYLEDKVAETMGRLVAAGTEEMLQARALGSDFITEWAFTGMAVLAASYRGGGIERGYLSFLSHWKEFLSWQPEGVQIEQLWEKAYNAQSTTLRRLVCAVLEGPHHATVGSTSKWRHWANTALDDATRSAELGEIQITRPDSWLDRANHIDPASVGRWELAGNRTYSDFHERFRQLDTAQFGLEVEFASYRFVESVQFRLFLLAGVAPGDRTALAYFLSRAVEDELSISWQDIISRGLARQAVSAAEQRRATA